MASTNIIGNSAQADKTYTVQDFIALRTADDITYYNYSILEYLNGFDMFVTNLLYDYEDELVDLAVTINLTDIEKIKYRYKPYLFAYDIYGSTETQFIIMMLNGIIDPKEFDFYRIKAIRPNDLYTLLGRIDSVNENFMNNNRSKLQDEFKKNEGNTIWTE